MPNADQALLELVKNAFDADASQCDIRIDRKTRGLQIEVEDDGVGMTAEELRDRWLLLGSSAKDKSSRTRRFKRIQVGDKGLGRLAALRLGKVATVATRKRGNPSYAVTLDWGTFQQSRSVDEVELDIAESNDKVPLGTTITIDQVRELSDRDVQRIARSLALVSDPFKNSQAFRVSLSGTRISKEDREVFDGKFFRFARFRVRARLDAERRLHMSVTRSDGRFKHSEVVKTTYDTVPFTFDLWEFVLSRSTLSTDPYPLTQIREWLGTFGGVHLFEGPIRIAPYGDRPVDWLDMNLLRVRSPEHRPSTNNSIGRVVLDNSSARIRQTTDRVSFVENVAYDDLIRACRQILNWVAAERSEEAELIRQRERKSQPAAEELRTSALQRLRSALTTEQLDEVEPVVRKAFEESAAEVKVLRADIMLYRAMATAGITAAVFAHEMGQSLGVIRRRIPGIIKVVSEAGLDVVPPLELVQKAASRLSAYIDLPGRFTSSARRRSSSVDIGKAIGESLEAFASIVGEDDIRITYQPSGVAPLVRGSKAMIEAIISNLVTNSVQAFRRGISKAAVREIRVRLRKLGKHVVLEYEDNAGGIRNIDPKKIWLPGETTQPGGTGFGLTIVRDTVTDIGGEVTAIPRTAFGGALFRFSIPTV